MTILAAPKPWRCPVEVRARLAPGLTDDETVAVRRALVFLRTVLGGAEKLAAALKVRTKLVEKYGATRAARVRA